MMESKSSDIITTSEAGASAGGGWRIRGYLTRWGEVDSYNDITVRGSFARTLAENKSLPLLWAHKYDEPPLGMVRAMREDNAGVFFIADIAKTQTGADMKKLVDMGALRGVSYSFDVKQYDRSTIAGKRVRRLLDVDLAEVSLTPFPALKSARLLDAQTMDELTIAEYETLKGAKLPITNKLLLEYVNAFQRIINRNEALTMRIDNERQMLEHLRR